MTDDLKQTVYGVILEFCRGKTAADIEKAVEFQELELDSVALVSILDEVEDALGIEFVEVPSMNITMPDFLALVDRLVAEKNG